MLHRIMVVGASGSGKSTLARKVGQRLGLPVIHLDAHFWQPGWREPDRDAFLAFVTAAAAGDRWVIDGQYSNTWEARASRADTIIWLDMPRRVYFWRVLRRTVRNYGRCRSDLADGCPERFDPAFLRYVWNYPRRSHANMAERLARESDRCSVVTLRSQAEIDAFLRSIAPRRPATLGISVPETRQT